MRQPFRAEFVAWGVRSVCGVLWIVTAGQMARTLSSEMNDWEAVLPVLLFAMPLALCFLALDILAEAVEQHLLVHHVTRRLAAWLRWTPHVGMLMFALFISMFALDVFGAGVGFWATAAALSMHLLPTFVLLIVLAVAWRWPWVGGVALLAMAGLFLLRFGPGWGGDWTLYLLFIGTPVMMALLFLASWWLRRTMGKTVRLRHAPLESPRARAKPCDRACCVSCVNTHHATRVSYLVYFPHNLNLHLARAPAPSGARGSRHIAKKSAISTPAHRSKTIKCCSGRRQNQPTAGQSHDPAPERLLVVPRPVSGPKRVNGANQFRRPPRGEELDGQRLELRARSNGLLRPSGDRMTCFSGVRSQVSGAAPSTETSSSIVASASASHASAARASTCPRREQSTTRAPGPEGAPPARSSCRSRWARQARSSCSAGPSARRGGARAVPGIHRNFSILRR